MQERKVTNQYSETAKFNNKDKDKEWIPATGDSPTIFTPFLKKELYCLNFLKLNKCMSNFSKKHTNELDSSYYLPVSFHYSKFFKKQSMTMNVRGLKHE
ncbi:hypothetical protein RND71_012723 [Anisodus tanguticus]|uniref:Uncharacterized protein n=1 Tax=Anisodus tanguticus TaxID=243964 RepID=A0AAE1SHM2_9SOLA|nr:hypothetical protein RND71_012723 [Anisodus tanguticus]